MIDLTSSSKKKNETNKAEFDNKNCQNYKLHSSYHHISWHPRMNEGNKGGYSPI